MRCLPIPYQVTCSVWSRLKIVGRPLDLPVAESVAFEADYEPNYFCAKLRPGLRTVIESFQLPCHDTLEQIRWTTGVHVWVSDYLLGETVHMPELAEQLEAKLA